MRDRWLRLAQILRIFGSDPSHDVENPLATAVAPGVELCLSAVPRHLLIDEVAQAIDQPAVEKALAGHAGLMDDQSRHDRTQRIGNALEMLAMQKAFAEMLAGCET